MTAVEKRIQEIIDDSGLLEEIDKKILRTQLEILVLEAKIEYTNKQKEEK